MTHGYVNLAPSAVLVELPPGDTTRWVASRKLAVIIGIQSGQISRGAALEKYSLSEEELSGWEKAHTAKGTNGLKTTKIQS
ncbi:MAG: hypothetical protein ACI9H6_000773 [Patiriisocius sp.]|jgi:hypothetical protein